MPGMQTCTGFPQGLCSCLLLGLLWFGHTWISKHALDKVLQTGKLFQNVLLKVCSEWKDYSLLSFSISLFFFSYLILVIFTFSPAPPPPPQLHWQEVFTLLSFWHNLQEKPPSPINIKSFDRGKSSVASSVVFQKVVTSTTSYVCCRSPGATCDCQLLDSK